MTVSARKTDSPHTTEKPCSSRRTASTRAKVDSKQIGFRINAAQSARTGSGESLTLGNNWSIAKGANLHLDYDAVVSASSAPINEQVLTIVFYVDWAA